VRSCGDEKTIVCGDFNAWNVEWGSRVTTPRGSLLSDLAWSLGLVLANRGSSPTFIRGEATTIIDITFTKNTVVTEWRVLPEDSLSDHQYLAFSVDVQESRPARAVMAAPPNVHPGWSVRKRDLLAFANYVETYPWTVTSADLPMHAAASSRALDDYLVGACDASMPQKRRGPATNSPCTGGLMALLI